MRYLIQKSIVAIIALLCPTFTFGQSVQPAQATVDTQARAKERMKAELRQLEDSEKQLRRDLKQAKSEYQYQLQLIQQFESDLDEQNVSTDSFSEIVTYLQKERIKLAIELAGCDARFSALEKAQKDGPADSKPADSNFQKQSEEQLKRMLQAQTEMYEVIESQRATGQATKLDILTARKAMMEAEMRLLEFRSKSNQSRQAFDNSDLIDIVVERGRLRAQLEHIQNLLAELVQLRPKIREIRSIERQLPAYLDFFTSLNGSLKANMRQIDRIKNTVSETPKEGK